MSAPSGLTAGRLGQGRLPDGCRFTLRALFSEYRAQVGPTR